MPVQPVSLLELICLVTATHNHILINIDVHEKIATVRAVVEASLVYQSVMSLIYTQHCVNIAATHRHYIHCVYQRVFM